MNIEIVTIGDELLLGETIDTNAAWLARELGDLGISVVRRATVGDEAAAISSAVSDALERTGAVITTGGLGPTSDDRTRPAIAGLFGRELHENDAIWQGLRAIWRERGRQGEPPPANRQQALVPEGATVLANRHGTAPGLWIEDDRGRWVAMLPGVPREMRGLTRDELLPRLRDRLGDDRRVVRSFTLRTTGVAESMLPDLLGQYSTGVDDATLAYLPGQEGVDLRLTVRNVPPHEADRLLEESAGSVRPLLGKHWYTDGSIDLAEVVISLCRTAAKHIAVAESCTGGLLAARLTSISGSSRVFRGGIVAYDNSVKIEQLGVGAGLLERVGAVSEEVARAMATGARRSMKAEIGVGITGVAGPEGGTPEKPVGLVWIAVDANDSITVFQGRFIGDREEIRFRSTQAALDMIRRELLGIA
jgi:nicotinamide-nucleotide amidase